MYSISVPFSNLGNPVIVSVQSLSLLNDISCISLSFAFNVKVTVSGLGLVFCELLLSIHTLFTVISLSAGLCVLVRVVTVPSVVIFVSLYPSGNEPSVQVYSISLPSLFLGSFSTFAVQLFSSFNVTSVPLDRVTFSSSGLIPSWLLASSHTFLTVASVSSGVCVLVKVVTVPLTEVSVNS